MGGYQSKLHLEKEKKKIVAEKEAEMDEMSENESNVQAEAAEDSTETNEAESSEESAESDAELTHEEQIAQLEQKVADAEAKAAEHFDLLQRKAAEFQNSKRRQEKLVSEQIDRASTKVIQKLLPALDDFDLAFRNLPEGVDVDGDAWVSGFLQIQKKLMTLLQDEEVIVVAQEGEFDPNQHEAISSEPNDEVESGHIIETLRLGYEHKGRILRPALVRVAM